jgi:hypothetical protein
MKTLCLFFAFTLLTGAQEILTNESIAKMAKAGLGESLIISMIQNQPGKYSLTPDDLLKLKKEGVSEKVLATMVNKAPAKAEVAAPEPAAPAPSAPPAPAPAAAPAAAPAPAPAAAPPENTAEQAAALKNVHKVYIEKMDNDLDQYLRAEIVKQFKGKLTVVLDLKNADAILAGVSEQEKGTGAKVTGRYLGLHDVATGTSRYWIRKEKPSSGRTKPVTAAWCSAPSNAAASAK